MVLSCDEKSQIKALERTQPGLPLGLGHIATQTHDYYRHGTVTLFAALDYLSGKVIAQAQEQHRHQEWIKFLITIDEQTQPDLALHIICDNYATHKHPKVKAWLRKHPRFHIHFTPTSSSWLNLIERFSGTSPKTPFAPGVSATSPRRSRPSKALLPAKMKTLNATSGMPIPTKLSVKSTGPGSFSSLRSIRPKKLPAALFLN